VSFQAEDGIRALHVTGVQTCALPIWVPYPPARITTFIGSTILELVYKIVRDPRSRPSPTDEAKMKEKRKDTRTLKDPKDQNTLIDHLFRPVTQLLQAFQLQAGQ